MDLTFETNKEIIRNIETIIKKNCFGFNGNGRLVTKDVDGKFRLIGDNYARCIIRNDYINNHGNIPHLCKIIDIVLKYHRENCLKKEEGWQNLGVHGRIEDEVWRK